MSQANPPGVPIEARPGCLRVTETYLCLEGEGVSLGCPTFLVRLSGCNLRCWWCDSKFSSFDESEARELGWEALRDMALESGAGWVSFTGGEPTFRGGGEMESLALLCRALRGAGRKVKVETNGLLLPAALDGAVDLWSVAPKWDGSLDGGAQSTPAMRFDLGALAEFCRRFGGGGLQLKFVITSDSRGLPRESDLERVRSILAALPEARRTPVLLVPEGLSSGADYAARCRALGEAALAGLKDFWRGWDLRVLPQWHRVLYGDARKR